MKREELRVGAETEFAVCTCEMESMPAAITTSIRSMTTCFDAMEMLMRPDEHCRSTVCPATVIGNPAAKAAVRPMVCCRPCGNADPTMQSSISSGSTSRARLRRE